ncbi:MAG: hypothetical protein ACFFB2_18745 [Promethearchaeota archaeon]
MEVRNVFVAFLTILFLILILGSIAALIFHVINYDVPIYTTHQGSSGGEIVEEVVLSELYIGKRDTNVFLEILALFILSGCIFYAGLLNYLKKPTLKRRME